MKVSKESITRYIKKGRLFITKNKKLILASAISYFAGLVTFVVIAVCLASADPVDEYVDIALLEEANAEINTLENKLYEKENIVSDLESKVTTLQAKVDEAAPWYKMKDEEKKKTEAEAKAAEEKRLAEEKAKKEAEDKLNNPTQEDLLKEIRDLLKENNKK